MAEFVAYVKANAGKVNYGSAGLATITHLYGEILNLEAGIKLVHVPYKGSAQATQDLLGGQIQAQFDQTVLTHIQAGRLIALGIHDGKRFPVAPEIPTTAEGGVPGSGRASGFLGLFTTAGTPEPVVRALSREVQAILALPQVQTR